MNLSRKHKIALGAAAILAAGGGGAAAVAATAGSSSDDSQAILDDAAKELGVSPSRLSEALKKALRDRVDEAVAAGRLTKAEGDALRERIQSEDFPLFGVPHRGFGHLGHFGDLDAAASYLGVSEAELRSELQGGKSLAQVAREQGKSVDGLVDALVAAAKERLDRAVAAGHITKAHEDSMLDELRERIEYRVNATGFWHPPDGFRHFGFRHFGFGHLGRSA
jgi:hypothetical protein